MEKGLLWKFTVYVLLIYKSPALFSTVRKNKIIFLSFPTDTRTSLQVEWSSDVLVGGTGSLVQFFYLRLYSINFTTINLQLSYQHR